MANREFFDSMADQWDNIAFHDMDKIQKIVDLLDLRHSKNILDIGCGTGILLPFLKKNIPYDGKIIALDISSKMIERAREKYGNDQIEYICKDFFEYDSKEGYDYAIAYSCLPHFVERRKFLLKAKEMLRKDGKLVIAHSESREKINCHHREMKSDIEFKDLERIEELSTLGKEIGLNVIRTIDTEEMYVLEMTLGQG